jgi:hypothetical protein
VGVYEFEASLVYTEYFQGCIEKPCLKKEKKRKEKERKGKERKGKERKGKKRKEKKRKEKKRKEKKRNSIAIVARIEANSIKILSQTLLSEICTINFIIL